MRLVPASTPGHIAETRLLFREYEAFLGFDLCFQSFDEELLALPGKYAPPDGRLFLADADGAWAGCVALRRLDGRACEMKRLFVRPGFRGLGVGRALAEGIVAAAREAGYREMQLDTVPKLEAAIGLYRAMGFVEIPQYCPNPIPGALFFRLRL